MTNPQIIMKKINAIQHNLARIKSFQPLALEVFLTDDDVREIITHNLFVMLQNVIDIGTYLIADAGLPEPDFLGGIPDLLFKGKIIPQELVGPLKAMIGLRNLIAHQYGDLDFKIIHTIVSEKLNDINSFSDAIIKYCRL